MPTTATAVLAPGKLGLVHLDVAAESVGGLQERTLQRGARMRGQDLRDRRIAYVSALWVVPVAGRQLKVRATVPASGMLEAQARKLAGSRVREILERVCTSR